MAKPLDLTRGSILSTLVRFALPVLLALILQALYGAVDLLVVGRFALTEDASGVATGSMLMSTATMVVTGLAMGITILVGESIGEGRPQRAGQAIGGGIFLSAVLAALLTVLLVVFAGPLATLMKAPAEAFRQASTYIRICGGGAVFIVAYNTLGSTFRGIGDSRTPLLTVAIACCINIAGDLLFVAGFGLGAAGAALATVLAQAVSVVISLLLIRRRSLPFTFSWRFIRWDPAIVGKELKLGWPIALQELLVGFSFLLIQTIVNGFGVVSSAAIGVGEKVCAFLMLVPSAFGQSMSAFVAQNMGAGNPARARRALGCGVALSLCIGAGMFWLSFFHGDLLAGIFIRDAAVIAQAQSYLKAYGIDCLLTAVLFCMIGYFNGREHTFFVMVEGLVGALLVRTPVAWLMSRTEGVTLFRIGLATPMSSLVQILMFLVMFLRLEREDRKAGLTAPRTAPPSPRS